MNLDIIRKVKEIIKKNEQKCIELTFDFTEDRVKHNFSQDLIADCLLNGYHCTKDELYPNPERYSSPYYSLYCSIFRNILIGYNYRINSNILILIHTSPLGNWEKQQLDKFKKKL